MVAPRQIFTLRFDRINRTVPYNPAWANTTGYFNYVENDSSLISSMRFGDQVKSRDEAGRRMIITLTRYGVFTVFQRYPDIPRSAARELAEDIYVCNASRALECMYRCLLDEPIISAERLMYLLGDPEFPQLKNLGACIEEGLDDSRRKPAVPA